MKILKLNILALLAVLFFVSSCDREPTTEMGTIDPLVPSPEMVDTNPLVTRSSGGENGLDLDCFTIDYPFELIDTEEIAYLITSDEDFDELLLNEALLIVDFVYPLNISYEDGETGSVADADELGELFASCVPQGGWEDGQFPAYLIDLENSCYEFVYPMTLVDEEGNEIVVENEDEFSGALAEELLFFVFPFSLVDEEGEVVVVGDIEELFDTLFACSWDSEIDSIWDWENGFEYVGCYLVEFPLDIITGDGSTVTVENHMELCDYMITGDFAGYAFPLDLIGEDGEVITVSTEEELEAALDECWDDWGEGCFQGIEDLFALLYAGDDLDCFIATFPITISTIDGEEMVIESPEGVEEYLPLVCEVVYPVTIVYTNGDTTTLGSSEELYQAVEDCE